MKKPYPPEEGWLRLTYTMSSKTALGEDQIKKLATFGHVDEYEFAVIEQHGAKLKVIMRRKYEAKALAEKVVQS